MTILGQDFYTAHNTVKDVAQSVAIGQEVDRKKNLMGSLNDLYQQKPNASLEDLRAQYAVYGTPDDLARVDDKIYGRDLTKASTKFKFYQDQLNFAKESQDAPAQQAIVASMNNDPEIGKFIGDVQITPTGTYQFTATNKMKFPNPANPKEMVDILPGDIYQINQNNQLTKVNSQYRQATDLANTKAQLRQTLKGSSNLPNYVSDALVDVQNNAIQNQELGLSRLNAYLNDPQFIAEIKTMSPEQQKNYMSTLRSQFPTAPLDKMMKTAGAMDVNEFVPSTTNKGVVQQKVSFTQEQINQIKKDAKAGNPKAIQVMKNYGIK